MIRMRAVSLIWRHLTTYYNSSQGALAQTTFCCIQHEPPVERVYSAPKTYPAGFPLSPARSSATSWNGAFGQDPRVTFFYVELPTPCPEHFSLDLTLLNPPFNVKKSSSMVIWKRETEELSFAFPGWWVKSLWIHLWAWKWRAGNWRIRSYATGGITETGTTWTEPATPLLNF